MKFLLTVIRIYIWLIVAWALMSWIPILATSTLRQIIGIPIVPLLKLFGFAQLGIGGGGIGFQPLILIFILTILERWIEKKYQEQMHAGYAGDTVKDRHGFEGKPQQYTETERPWYEKLETEAEKEQKKYGKSAPRGDISTPYRPVVHTGEGESPKLHKGTTDASVEDAEFSELSDKDDVK